MKKNRQLFSAILALALIVSLLAGFPISAQAAGEPVQLAAASEASEFGHIHMESPAADAPRYTGGSSSGVSVDSVLPDRYDARDDGYITPVKSQGSTGMCWSFAAMAASEASLIKNNGWNSSTNLSELHLAYQTYNNAYDPLGLLAGDGMQLNAPYNFTNFGGNSYYAASTLTRWAGAADETTAPFENVSANYSMQPEQAYSEDIAYADQISWISPLHNPDGVKKAILEHGAGVVSYYDEYRNALYYNSSTYGYYYNGADVDQVIPNHDVTIIGWDDAYSRDNFNTTPPGDGAWLIKNSWGSYSGSNSGYFWMSYYDAGMLTSEVAFFQYAETDAYDRNYQYDGVPTLSWYIADGYMANVYTATTSEALKAVSFWTLADMQSYEIEIYTDLTGNTPVSGTKAAQTLSGTMDLYGYHTITLDTPVYLAAGSRFSIVIRMSGNGTSGRLATVKNIDYGFMTITNASEAGQSYMSNNKSSWTDIGRTDGYNFCIKAFTEDAPEPPEEFEKVYSLTDLKAGGEYVIVLDDAEASGSPVYTMANETVGTNGILLEKDSPAVQLNADKTVLETSAKQFVWTVEEQGGQLYLKNRETGQYLYHTSGTTARMNSTGSSITFGAGSGGFRIYSNVDASRFLGFYASGGNQMLRFYTTSNSDTVLNIYKKKSMEPLTCAGVSADPGGGEIEPGTPITLTTDTDNGNIYYRVLSDGTSSDWTLYTSPVTLPALPATLEAYAGKDGYYNSAVTAYSYTQVPEPVYTEYEKVYSLSEIKAGEPYVFVYRSPAQNFIMSGEYLTSNNNGGIILDSESGIFNDDFTTVKIPDESFTWTTVPDGNYLYIQNIGNGRFISNPASSGTKTVLDDRGTSFEIEESETNGYFYLYSEATSRYLGYMETGTDSVLRSYTVQDNRDRIVPFEIYKLKSEVSGVRGTFSLGTSNSAKVELIQNEVVQHTRTLISGEFSFADLPAGSYSVRLTIAGCVPLTIENIQLAAGMLDLTALISTVIIPRGDIDGDGFVSISDVSEIMKTENYGKPVANASNPACDINGDGLISIEDIAIVMMTSNYGKGPIKISAS